MEKIIVAPGKFVEIEYVLSEATQDGQIGELLEECSAENAFGFNVGSGEVLESFENALKGLKMGEPFEVAISKSHFLVPPSLFFLCYLLCIKGKHSNTSFVYLLNEKSRLKSWHVR